MNERLLDNGVWVSQDDEKPSRLILSLKVQFQAHIALEPETLIGLLLYLLDSFGPSMARTLKDIITDWEARNVH